MGEIRNSPSGNQQNGRNKHSSSGGNGEGGPETGGGNPALIHGQYNEEMYEVLQQSGEEGRTWEQVYRRAASEVTSAETGACLSADRMKEYCRSTCEEVARERSTDEQAVEVGQVMYLPRHDQNGREIESPEGHEVW
jgi:hypothetical protein